MKVLLFRFVVNCACFYILSSFSRKQSVNQWKKYRGMFYFLIEKHMQTFSLLKGKKFTHSIYFLFHPTEVVPGLGNGPVARGQAGNPFVFKDPTFSAGQGIGAGLFEPGHDQQPTSTGGIKTQVGLHLGGPFSSNTWQRTAPQPVSGSHFQLAVASHFTGANPFSPSVPGRTRSMEDFLREPRAADQNRQARSAPVVPEMLKVSHFQFPSKKSVQFYLPRIKVHIDVLKYYFKGKHVISVL